MNNTIERFTVQERLLHWLVAITFFIQVVSGLGLYSRLFHGWFNFFGGGENAILFHKISGVLFYQSSLLLLQKMWKDVGWFDADDREWFRNQGGYLTKKEMHFNTGKYNPGQKLFALFIGGSATVLGISGIFIWGPTLFPRWIVQASLLVHGLIFVLSVMFVIVHVYLGTIGNPGTSDAMIFGHVKRIWAKKHHPRWCREVTEGENQ